MTSLPYYKSLDGIRGVAVLMVVLIHSRLLPFGWIGVQIFFVLSGFLITGILLSQTDRPFLTFIRRFYWRRGLRIWPLYFLFLALCAVSFAFLRIPETWNSAWPRLASFTYNFALISPAFKDSDYFGHFWTLCVEEQFYLVWPFAVYLLRLNYFRKLVFLMVLAGPFIRYFTGIWLAGHLDSLSVVGRTLQRMPMSHLDAFACGALLAALPADTRKRIAPNAKRIFLAVLALTMTSGLLQAWFLWRRGLKPYWSSFGYGGLEYFYQYLWAYSLLNLTSVCLIFCALEDSVVARLLSFRPLAFIGAISFGVYVWHLPLMRIFSAAWPAGQHSLAGLCRFVVYFFATVGLAALSYYGFERHFLEMKHLSMKQIFRRGGQTLKSRTK